MIFSDLQTPQVLIDRRKALANIARMQQAVGARGIRLRPHAKTHKIPDVARWQIEHGAVGICCAKVGEAEIFAEAGVPDIRLPYPVNPAKALRVRAVARKTRLSIIVDHPVVARAWSDLMEAAGERLDVLVKVDVGFHRCGIDPDCPDANDFIRQVSALPGLRLRGLLSHAGHGYGAGSDDELESIAVREAQILNRLASGARAAGVAIEEISVGATPTARFSLGQPGITEMRPGNYVYFDRTQVALGAAALDDCALTVLAMVVAKPAADRIILDCGSKTLGMDAARGTGKPAGYGAVLASTDSAPAREDASLLIERLSEEHATVRVLTGSTQLEPGDRVRVLPNHACVVSNMVDAVCFVDGGDVQSVVPVAARGRIA